MATDAFLLMAFVNELFATHQVKPGRLLDFTDGIEKLEPLSAPFTPSAVAAITRRGSSASCRWSLYATSSGS